MELASFKVCIKELTTDELMALMADIRTSRRPITDLTDIKERAKPKARSSSGGGKVSLSALKASLSPEQIQALITKLSGE